MDRKQNIGSIMVIIAGCLWGSTGLFSTLLQNRGMDSLGVAFFRLLSAVLWLIPVLLISGRGFRLFKISHRGLLSCLAIGLFSQALFNMFFMTTISRSGMASATVLLYTSPVFVAIMSRMFFREPLGRNKILAILVNILGCILTVTGGALAGLSLAGTGILTGVAAGFMYATLPVLSRIGADRENPLTAAFYGLLFGTMFSFFIVRPWQGVGTAIDGEILLILLGLGLIPTALPYIFYFSGLSRITETSRVPVLASVETVMAAQIGYIAFGQGLTPIKILGIGLVLFSIFLMNKKSKSPALEEPGSEGNEATFDENRR